MGWQFWKPKTEIVRLDTALQQSFEKVKTDVLHVHEWIRFLHKQNEYQSGLIKELTEELKGAHDRVPSQNQIRTIIKQEVDDSNQDLKRSVSRQIHHNHNALRSSMKRQVTEHFQRYEEAVFTRLRNMETKMQELEIPKENKSEQIFERLASIMEKLEERNREPAIAPQPIVQTQPVVYPSVSNLQRKILKKVQRNSKEYVKNVMLSMIRRYQRMPGLQVKEMLVDEQQLVSKSSLYRLLNELVEEGRISVSQDGKEKLYLYSSGENIAENENPNI